MTLVGPSRSGLLGKLAAARGSRLQLPLYAAVLAGIRRSLDDWIPLGRLEPYRGTLRSLGLYLEVDAVFDALGSEDQPRGLSRVPTTRARGLKYPTDSSSSEATAHVIVSSRRDWAEEALAASWYPVAVGDVVLRKPLAEHERFGLALGYPPCCVEFFLDNNDWPRLNTVAEAVSRSARLLWEANSFPRHTPWMTVFHLPCAFDCEGTRLQSRAVLQAVRSLDPDYASSISTFMRWPILTTSEVTSYCLRNGRASRRGVRYEEAIPLGGRPDVDWYGARLSAASEVSVAEGCILLWCEDELIDLIECRADLGMVEVPLLLTFDQVAPSKAN